MLMIHSNYAAIEDGLFVVDRKFHDGLSFMASRLNRRIATANPRWLGYPAIMDMIRIPLDELAYDVLILDLGEQGQLTEASRGLLDAKINEAGLVIGQSFQAGEASRRLGIPYVALVEYDLGTQLVAGTAGLTNPVRKMVRSLRIIGDYHTRQKTDLRGAFAVHCNGYPIYQATNGLNENRLLYLDSRLSSSAVITKSQLDDRLASAQARPLRLLYSGRFTAMKGVVDVVKVAIECQRQNVEVEVSLYGQGEDREQIISLISSAPYPERICVFEPVEFPRLMEIAKEYDLFICCHLQSDPSCTYIESFGAGLPIVGYGNRMWTALQAQSQAGTVTKMHDINAVVASIADLAADRAQLAMMSHNAREFCLTHSFEAETQKRVNSMNDAIVEVFSNRGHDEHVH